MSSFDIGFVGPGAMGAPMVRRLLANGHRVLVYARDPARVTPLIDAGAVLSTTPGELASQVDVVLGCLRGNAAVTDVYRGPEGLLETARPGQVFVEHGTFSQHLAADLAEQIGTAGAAFIDAPVTGGPEGAAAGTLLAMAGGDRSALDAVDDIVDVYTREVVHVGGSGAGSKLKLVNQLLTGCHVAVAAEAAVALQRAGIEEAAARRALAGGWAKSAMLDRVLDRAYRGDYRSDSTVAGLAEVFDLVEDLTNDLGIDCTMFPAAHRMFDRAIADGEGDRDVSVLAALLMGPRPSLPTSTAADAISRRS